MAVERYNFQTSRRVGGTTAFENGLAVGRSLGRRDSYAPVLRRSSIGALELKLLYNRILENEIVDVDIGFHRIQDDERVVASFDDDILSMANKISFHVIEVLDGFPS